LRESYFDLQPRVLLIEWFYFQQFGSSQGVIAEQIGSSGLLLDFKSLRLYSPKYLVFGKAVRVRHYPVTVSTENRAGKFQPLAALLPGRRSSSLEV
jgi:hypothetical protein